MFKITLQACDCHPMAAQYVIGTKTVHVSETDETTARTRAKRDWREQIRRDGHHTSMRSLVIDVVACEAA